MTPTQLSLVLFILNMIFMTSQSDDPKKCVALTRATVEEKFGKPVKCRQENKNEECFSRNEVYASLKLQFDESGVVKKIEYYTGCSGVQGLKRELEQIVPVKDRGKYIKHSDLGVRWSCQSVSEEEYECVKIKYSQENCMNCVPASVIVVWK